jgi:peroxiredoxin
MLNRLLIGVIYGIATIPCVLADAPSNTLIGRVAPNWQGLPKVSGKLGDSSEITSPKATLVVFLCNHCPCAKGYETRFNDFASKFRKQGVAVVAFNADTEESLAEMEKRAKESQFQFDYLRDESQAVAKAFGARTTPHVFVLDENRKIVFSGAFDDDMRGKNITKTYVVDAVEAVLAGRNVEVAESRLCGCAIQYKK